MIRVSPHTLVSGLAGEPFRIFFLSAFVFHPELKAISWRYHSATASAVIFWPYWRHERISCFGPGPLLLSGELKLLLPWHWAARGGHGNNTSIYPNNLNGLVSPAHNWDGRPSRLLGFLGFFKLFFCQPFALLSLHYPQTGMFTGDDEEDGNVTVRE